MGEAFITRRGGGAPLNFKVVGGVGAVAIDAGTVLGTIHGRTYTKTNGGKAVWAFVNNGQYTGPMLVSPDSAACSYSTSGDYVDAIIARDTVTYNGKTYYYSAGSWMGGDVPSGLSPFIEKSEVDAALMLAKTYEAIENPKENTIWVNTDTEITGWHFGPEEHNVVHLTATATDAHYIHSPCALHDGDIVNFVIPQTVNGIYEAIRIQDPVTGKLYFLRQGDGSAVAAWPAGMKVAVRLINESIQIGDWGGGACTARLLKWASYYHEEGTVWIQPGTTSPVAFNALKKNSIQVCPLNAKQYVGGAWALKDAETYQGGAWVGFWTGDLFKNGDQFESITGGWVQANYQVYGSENSDAGTLTIGDTIDITANGGQCCKSARTNNKIDLTNYNTITVTGTCMYLLISTSTSGVPAAIATENAKSLDISGFSGEYYVGVMARNYGSMSAETIKLS